MTAEVVVSFSTPTASVVSGGGNALFSALTAVVIAASGISASFESNTASATAISGSASTVEAQFAKNTASATIAVGRAYSVASAFEELTAVVAAPDVIRPAFEEHSAAVVAISGVDAAVSGSFAPFQVSVVHSAQGLATGSPVFSYLTAEVTGAQLSPATITASFGLSNATAYSISGRVAEIESEFEELTAAVVSAPTATGTASAAFERTYATIFSEPTLASTFRTWTVNPRNLDITEYTNFAFNSYANFNGYVYAAGASGVMKLTGADDNGTSIEAVARLGAVGDRKDNRLSRIPEVVIAGASAAPITVTVFQEDGTSFSYDTQYTGVSTLRQHRATPGKGLRSTRFKVQFENNNGAAMELGPVMVNTVPVTRRLGG